MYSHLLSPHTCLSGFPHGHVMVPSWSSWSPHGPHGHLSCGSLTVLSRFPHSSLTVLSRFPHSSLTVLSRFPHSSLEVPSRFSQGRSLTTVQTSYWKNMENILPKTFETKKHLQQVFYLKHLLATLKNRKYLWTLLKNTFSDEPCAWLTLRELPWGIHELWVTDLERLVMPLSDYNLEWP